MKEIIKKYFNYIGVNNEGHRRLLTIIIVLFGLCIYPFLEGNFYYEGIIDYLIFDDFEYSFFFYLHMFITSPIIVGVVVKIYYWVKEGFSK